MKKLILTVFVCLFFITGCVTSNNADFSEVPGQEWKLIEVSINGRNTGFNRAALSGSGLGETFTLSFDADIVSGTGSPNRYSAPYTLGENMTISIVQVRSTLMASIGEPQNLREHDFFNYVQNAYKWNITDNKLELFSKPADGSEVKLVFSL